MDCGNKLENFAKKHNLLYKKQEFKNCYNGNWVVHTYSLYNDLGCFTIHHLLQRNEIDFYFSSRISNELKNLKEKEINVFAHHKEIWNQESKILFFRKPFFFESINKVISTLIIVMELEIKDKNQIFGLILNENQ